MCTYELHVSVKKKKKIFLFSSEYMQRICVRACCQRYFSNANAEFPFLAGLACYTCLHRANTSCTKHGTRAHTHIKRLYAGSHPHRHVHTRKRVFLAQRRGHTHTHTERVFEAAWLECAWSSGRLAGDLYGVSAFRSPNMRGNNLLVC